MTTNPALGEIVRIVSPTHARESLPCNQALTTQDCPRGHDYPEVFALLRAWVTPDTAEVQYFYTDHKGTPVVSESHLSRYTAYVSASRISGTGRAL